MDLSGSNSREEHAPTTLGMKRLIAMRPFDMLQTVCLISTL